MAEEQAAWLQAELRRAFEPPNDFSEHVVVDEAAVGKYFIELDVPAKAAVQLVPDGSSATFNHSIAGREIQKCI